MYAIKLWSEQKRDELLEYCAHDVACLAKLVLLNTLKVPNIGTVQNQLYGVATAVAVQRLLQPLVDDQATATVGDD